MERGKRYGETVRREKGRSERKGKRKRRKESFHPPLPPPPASGQMISGIRLRYRGAGQRHAALQ
ncbi:hypothetical protein J6590_047024 [Homalodisca vitripennis]|nr:hypothetical protein J6590_047024 [Homalodisca vitripennis]